MPTPRYRLIRGEFHVLYPDLPRNGPEPDGDTITFLPDDDGLVPGAARFDTARADRNHLGTDSVRFEGVDALETHLANQHQNLEFARAARDRVLAEVGFTRVEFFDDRPDKVRSADPRRDDPAQLPTGERGHLHDLYQVDEQGISLRIPPEQVAFPE